MSADTPYGSSSMHLSHLGTDRFYGLMAKRAIQVSNNASFADEKVAWTLPSSSMKDVKAAYKANWKLKNNSFWDENLNLTDAAGQMKESALYGKEVIDVEQEFSSLVRDAIEAFLWDRNAKAALQDLDKLALNTSGSRIGPKQSRLDNGAGDSQGARGMRDGSPSL
jgi:hypothetical protein